MKGRTVRIYLVDGTPSGVLTAEIMNWTGRVTVAPRSQLPDLATRSEVRRTGVYVLSGSSLDNPAQEMIYVGESDNVWERLAYHNRDASKEFWNRTVIITSKDENLTKSHVRYLESQLIQAAVDAKRVDLANGTNPEPTSLPEPDIADMDGFLEQIQMLLPVLGFNFATPLQEAGAGRATAESPLLTITYGGSTAEAQEINAEFVVFKGATARKRHTPSLAPSLIQMRQQLRQEGKLADGSDPEYWTFTQNVPFSSLSTAAAVVGGAQLNGRTAWHLKETGQTYGDWQEAQVERAEPGDSAS